MRVAVVGLFRSGSSFWSKVLHRLGVNMGDTFWENDEEDNLANHYEARRLRDLMVDIWHEPSLERPKPKQDRIGRMREWIDYHATKGHQNYGGKHPLLSMAVDEVLEAWGPDTAIMWCRRPIEESLRSIHASNFPWPPEAKDRIQRVLWEKLGNWFADHPPTMELQFEWIGSPIDTIATNRAIDEIVEKLGLTPSPDQMKRARNSHVSKLNSSTP